MSFADFTIIILSALSTVTWVPGRKAHLGRRLRGGASRETVNSVSSVMRLFLTACSVTYIVISLVIEAGYHGIGGILGVQHLAGVGLDQQRRFGRRRVPAARR